MKNRNIFQQLWFVRSNCNSKSITTCCEKLDALSSDELRVVSLAQTVILHRTTSWTQLKKKKKKWIRMEFWRIPELMAHLEDDL